MSAHLRDLLHELADHETRAVAARPVPASEARRMRAEIVRRRTRRAVGAGFGAAAAVVVGIVAAQALTSTPPLPAVPEPSASPSVSLSVLPTPQQSPTGTPTEAAAPARTSHGLVGPLPEAPHELWTARTADLVTGWSAAAHGGRGPFLGSISSYPQGQWLHAEGTDDVWVLGLGDAADDHVVGVDAHTGEHLWDLPVYVEETDLFLSCGGFAPDGALVCLSASDVVARLVLLDPRTGTTTRELPLDVIPYSVGVDGDLAVLHGIDAGTESVHREAVSTATGEVVWSHVEEGVLAGVPEGMDWTSETRVHGGRARLTGLGYDVEVDTRTGEVLARTTTDPLVVDVDPRIGTTTFEAEASGDVVRLRASASADGPELWTFEGQDPRVVGVVGDAVVVSDRERLSLLDAATGEVRWSVGARTLVAFDGTRLVTRTGSLGEDTTLEALDLTDGSTVWSVPVGARQPVVVGGSLALDDGGNGTLTRLAP